MTRRARGLETKLFISAKPPHKPVSKQTVVRWVKEILTTSGVDPHFLPHSTRHAATSAALRWEVGPRKGNLTHCSREGRQRGEGEEKEGGVIEFKEWWRSFLWMILWMFISMWFLRARWAIVLRSDSEEARERGIERRRWIIAWNAASLWETWWNESPWISTRE